MRHKTSVVYPCDRLKSETPEIGIGFTFEEDMRNFKNSPPGLRDYWPRSNGKVRFSDRKASFAQLNKNGTKENISLCNGTPLGVA